VNKKFIVALAIVLTLIFSFIYVTASGISQLSNEKVLFLFLDETKGDPGTVEVASLAVFENAALKEDLIKINPLSSTDFLKKEGVFLSDSFVKAKSLEEGIQNAKTVAEEQTHSTIDRVVLVDAFALKSVIDAVHPIPIDIQFSVIILDRSFDLKVRTQVTGKEAEQCIRGEEYPGVENEELLKIPEDYLWEVKSEVINAVTTELFDFPQYNTEEQKRLAHVVTEQYRNDLIEVHEKNAVLVMVYYLPESISKLIVNFAVRRIA
jgi:hypothetical protein